MSYVKMKITWQTAELDRLIRALAVELKIIYIMLLGFLWGAENQFLFGASLAVKCINHYHSLATN